MKRKVSTGARRRKSARSRDGVQLLSSPHVAPAAAPTYKRSKAEQDLALAILVAGFRTPEEEFRFHPTRRWRFDFAFPIEKIAIEVEGGVFSRGRHVRPAGVIADAEKYNEAALLGWTVLRFVPRKDWLQDAVSTIKRAFRGDA